jgi:hypothetical protein
MKKIILLLFGFILSLHVANAQNITVFNYDGVTPASYDTWSDQITSVANPVSDGVNSSANVAEYNHNAQYSNVGIATTDIDARYYTSYQIKVYSPAAGTLQISCRNAADEVLNTYEVAQAATTGWTTITQNIFSSQTIKKIVIGFKPGVAPANDATDIIYLDDLTFIKTTEPEIYAENFSADIPTYSGFTGAPSTKMGKWSGGIDLETPADANIEINRYGAPSNNTTIHELNMNAGAATVTIPNINITGFNTFKLYFDNYAGTAIAPVIEYNNGGSWMPITVNQATSTWSTQSITLPALDNTQPLSLRFSSDATLEYFIDNLKLTGVPPPTITSFTPGSGEVGDSITITGTYFPYATGVSFNGVSAASFTIIDATTIGVKIPAGATDGTISVTTPSGTATSSTTFDVLTPTITSFTPGSGEVGDSITITGTNLSNATNVSFNGVNAASFTIIDATTIGVKVPASATDGTISVTTPSGTATSSSSFSVTVTGISAKNASLKVNVGPNPSSGIFNINTQETIDEIIVSDYLGNIISNSSNTQIDLSNQPDGLYFLTIISGDKKSVQKLAKQ